MSPSPVRLKTRPWWTAIVGSMKSLRKARRPRQHAILVRARETAEADDVGGKDGGDFAGFFHGALGRDDD